MSGIVIQIGDLTRHGASETEWALMSVVMDHTADLLPVVSNPKAVISKNSSIKDLGKVPSLYNYAGEVVGIAAWTEKQTTDREVELWAKNPDYGMFMQTRLVKALDVDVGDRELSRIIREFIAKFLGVELPERNRGNSGKFLLAFILPGSFGKRAMRVNGGVIEFLGTGNGFVVAGRHPSGVHYEWPNGFPPEFPTLTEEVFEKLWSALGEKFATGEVTVTGVSAKVEKVHEAIKNDPVAQYLIAQGAVIKTERDGRLHITCPWEHEHSMQGGDTATTYWPAYTGGYKKGHFHCLHAHCLERTDDQFKDKIGYVEIDVMEEFTALGMEVDAETGEIVSGIEGDVKGVSSGDTLETENEFEPVDSDVGTPASEPKPTVKRDRFHVWRPTEFANRPRPLWFIKGLFPKAEIGIAFGESAAGKTFFVLDLMLHIALGREWRGRKVKQAKVVYVCAEGLGGMNYRLLAWCRNNEVSLAELDGKFSIIADTPSMMDKNDALAVARKILDSGGAGIVVLDTWAQVTAGANENSGEDMGQALAHAKGISKALKGAMILMVHHAGKDLSKGARGWSGMRAAADCEIEISRGSDDFRQAKVTKLKDGIDGQEFGFVLEDVILEYDEDGDEVTSCVIKDVLIPAHREGPKGEHQKKAWQVIQEFGLAQKSGIEIGAVIGECLRTTTEKRDKRGADRRHDVFKRAIDGLAGKNLIEIDGDSLTIL